MTDDSVLVGEPLSIADVVRVARDGADVAITPAARTRMEQSRAYIERLVDEGRTVYGVTTGFGKLASERIAPADVKQLQRNLIVSHAMGVGEPLPTELGMLTRKVELLESEVDDLTRAVESLKEDNAFLQRLIGDAPARQQLPPRATP